MKPTPFLLARSAPLPVRDGVGPSCVALPVGRWTTMLEFLLARFPAISLAIWQARMAAGDVVDEDGRTVGVDDAFRAPLRLYYYRDARAISAEAAPPTDEEVLHHDAHLLVVDKPHFLAVTPSGPYLQQSLLVRLRRRLGIDELAPLHRLDRDTAGVMLFSTNVASRGTYQALFTRRAIDKRYEAIVHWHDGATLPSRRQSRIVEAARFPLMCEIPGTTNAETRFELGEILESHALLYLEPITGRKHQLRLHCAALGMPIVNDRMYPQLCPPGPDDHAKPLRLLARSIAFVDPLTGEGRKFSSARSLACAA
ncbi:MAG: pseudouridine synthase [Variovorax sp.]